MVQIAEAVEVGVALCRVEYLNEGPKLLLVKENEKLFPELEYLNLNVVV